MPRRSTSVEQTLTIGSDPEFVIVRKAGNSLSVIPAHSVVTKRGMSARIGTDGASTTGELRPKQATCPVKHYKNIRKLIRKSFRRFMLATRGEAEIHAGCCGKTNRALGGHIHFGARLDSRTTLALDYFLALPYRTMVANSDFSVRSQTGYGRLSEVRAQAWGSEYRTLSSWIVYPKITESVLCVAYVVADHYLHHRTPEAIYTTESDYLNGSLEALRAVARDASLKIESFRLYSKYKKQIQRFYRMVLDDHFQIDEGSNVWKNWLEEKTLTKVNTQYRQIRQQRATARFTFTGDDHLNEIQEAVSHIRWEGQNIQVYGLRRDRSHSVQFFNISGLSGISGYETQITLESEIWRSRPTATSTSPSVGFRMDLRETEEGRAKIIRILKNIAARMPNPVMEA